MTNSEATTAASTHRMQLLKNIWELFSLAHPQQRRSLGLAILFGVLASLGDIASMALLKVAISGVTLDAAHSAQASLAMFIVAAMVASLFRVAAIRQTVLTQYGLVHLISVASFERLQKQDYSEFIEHGASRAFAAFDRLYLILFHVLAPVIAALTAISSILFLLAGLAVIEPLIALICAGLVAATAIALSLRKGAATATGLTDMTNMRSRILSDGRSGFRDVFMTNGQDRLVSDFAAIDRELCARHTAVVTSAQSARASLELAVFGAALVGLAAMSMVGGVGQNMLPTLGVLALAGFRLLPQLASLRSAVHMISNHGEITEDVLALIRRPIPESLQNKLEVPQGSIQLQHVTVRRDGRPDPIRDLSLTIPRGARIGIAGASGAGKSTLLDVLAGAIKPDSGTLMVGDTMLDHAAGPAWRARIGFVSQHPMLLGANLRETVVFPDRPSEVDPVRFEHAVSLAGLDVMAAQLARGLDTSVGEVLEKLSGGQRHRVALAHALYRARDLLLLDEATGQLDHASELELIAAIDALPRDLSIVVVSHRPAMFRCCDLVYLLREGQLHAMSNTEFVETDAFTQTAVPLAH
jgi:ATP-binding cassette, subfamily B, bacterial PglK